MDDGLQAYEDGLKRLFASISKQHSI